MLANSEGSGETSRCTGSPEPRLFAEHKYHFHASRLKYPWRVFLYYWSNKKNLKMSNTQFNSVTILKFEKKKSGFTKRVMHPRDADWMANSVDPDQTSSRNILISVYLSVWLFRIMTVLLVKHACLFFRWCMAIWASSRENLSSEFVTRIDSNRSAQLQKLARDL